MVPTVTGTNGCESIILKAEYVSFFELYTGFVKSMSDAGTLYPEIPLLSGTVHVAPLYCLDSHMENFFAADVS